MSRRGSGRESGGAKADLLAQRERREQRDEACHSEDLAAEIDDANGRGASKCGAACDVLRRRHREAQRKGGGVQQHGEAGRRGHVQAFTRGFESEDAALRAGHAAKRAPKDDADAVEACNATLERDRRVADEPVQRIRIDAQRRPGCRPSGGGGVGLVRRIDPRALVGIIHEPHDVGEIVRRHHRRRRRRGGRRRRVGPLAEALIVDEARLV